MNTPTSITIDDVVYVRADSILAPNGVHVMVRSRDAGVFAGRLVCRTGDEVELSDARRIWRWEGAATLSELATRGTSKPSSCKFPASVPSIVVLGVCEVIPMTDRAVASIGTVPAWSQA